MLITGISLVSLILFAGKLISPSKPNKLKLSSYECGEEPTGTAHVQFNSRFYVIALIFLLFEVEMVFIFPWATVFGQKTILEAAPMWGWVTLTEMFIFVGILLMGLAYVWCRGDLQWIKPRQIIPVVNHTIPASAYAAINSEVYTVKSALKNVVDEPYFSPVPPEIPPAFKPSFRKVQK